MNETVFDNGPVVARVISRGSVCIAEEGQKIYLKPKELADIAEAVATYLKREAELKYEEFAWPPAGEA